MAVAAARSIPALSARLTPGFPMADAWGIIIQKILSTRSVEILGRAA